jgi:hypothetical protein
MWRVFRNIDFNSESNLGRAKDRVSPAVHPKLLVASKLMRIEEIGDTFDLDVTEACAKWVVFELRFRLRKNAIKFHLNRLGTHVRLGDDFGAKRFLQPTL